MVPLPVAGVPVVPLPVVPEPGTSVRGVVVVPGVPLGRVAGEEGTLVPFRPGAGWSVGPVPGAQGVAAALG